jgi:hypothetical protein
MKKIKSIVVDQIGLITNADGEITTMLVNGDMAAIVWYKQEKTEKEWNGTYVIEVQYETELSEHDQEMINEGKQRSDRDIRRGV